jgi:hypothetical protein
MSAIAWALFSTEWIKLRRTLALRLAVAAPLLAIVMQLMILLDRKLIPSGDAGKVWSNLLQNGWGLWLGFFVPMLVSLEAASLANLEHRGNQWKQLFAFPIPRWSVYAIKMLFCGLLLGTSFLLVAPGFVGNVLIVSAARGWHLESAIPWSGIMSTLAKAYVASWLVIVIQTWISARIAGIASPVCIGFAGLLLSAVLIRLLSSWCPWTLPLSTFRAGPYDVHNTVLPVWAGCIGGVVFGALACWDLGRRREGD